MNDQQKKEYNEWLRGFGRCLSTHRQKLGLTQKQAALKIGMHFSFYKDVEYGLRPISTRTLFQLCSKFNLPLPYQSTIGIICDTQEG